MTLARVDAAGASTPDVHYRSNPQVSGSLCPDLDVCAPVGLALRYQGHEYEDALLGEVMRRRALAGFPESEGVAARIAAGIADRQADALVAAGLGRDAVRAAHARVHLMRLVRPGRAA